MSILAGCGQQPSQTSTSQSPTPGSTNQAGLPVVRWGSDEAGGAPYEYRDPNDPNKRIGFETEIVDELAKRTKRTITFVQMEWPSLVPALQRGDFDFAMAGIEITPEREASVIFSRPYYIYTQQLMVHVDDTKTQSLDDLAGKKIGTLAQSAADRILTNKSGLEVVRFDDNTRPYEDLSNKRLDGVLLDLPLAVHYGKPKKDLRFAGKPFAPGVYAIAYRKQDTELKATFDKALDEMLADGTLKKILEKYALWNSEQDALTSGTKGK